MIRLFPFLKKNSEAVGLFFFVLGYNVSDTFLTLLFNRSKHIAMSKRMIRFFRIVLPAFFLMAGFVYAGEVPAPKSFFGFVPGPDRMLIDYEQLIGYLQKVDEASPRMKMLEIGKSPMGRPMYVAFFSSEENIKNLDRLKEINKKLALDPTLTAEQQQQYIREGKVFVVATLSMHSTEVAPSQAAPLEAYELTTTKDPEKLAWLDKVVFMMVPCHNPDGMDLVVKNYRKYKGTKYEGAALPRVYHKYVGHDNNRDFVILTQEDTRSIQRLFTQTWFPQVMVEKHQMGTTGPRYFVPPNSDPIAMNVDATMWTWTGIFGQNLINDMTDAGLAGVSQHYAFDDYWPGSTETCLWQNVIAFLTEAASARIASPVYIEPGELSVHGKGLSEYKKSINMPMPWEGGWWRLGDIVQYEVVSLRSIIKTAALYHDKILKFRNDICKKEVQKGKTQPPYYYIMPAEQHDESELVNLVNLLGEQGVSVYTLTKDMTVDDRQYHAGDLVVPLAQPFRAFIKEVMEKQEFPVRHYTPGGKIIRPYDITTWSLPLQRQVEAVEINTPAPDVAGALAPVKKPYTLLEQPVAAEVKTILLPVENNESFKAAFVAAKAGMVVERLQKETEIDGRGCAAGSFVISLPAKDRKGWDLLNGMLKFNPVTVPDKGSLSLKPLAIPRIALVETYYSDMDAGWTRYLFDTYQLPYTVLHPEQIATADLPSYDVIIFPSSSKTALLGGAAGSDSYYMSYYTPEYTKGMGKDGLKKLMAWFENGGKIISWGGSTALFEGKLTVEKKEGKTTQKEMFRLPYRDISSRLSEKGLYVPGSLIKICLRNDNPLTLGMPPHVGVFSRGRPVFETSIPSFDSDRRVLGYYPEKEILMSGYAEHPELMAGKAAIVWVRKGRGEMVLMGFNPQFRVSTPATFKLLFNAILMDKYQPR